MGVSIMNATEPVYMELVDFVARGSSAEQVANFRPSPEAQKRVAELLERQRESELTEEENRGVGRLRATRTYSRSGTS